MVVPKVNLSYKLSDKTLQEFRDSALKIVKTYETVQELMKNSSVKIIADYDIDPNVNPPLGYTWEIKSRNRKDILSAVQKIIETAGMPDYASSLEPPIYTFDDKLAKAIEELIKKMEKPKE